MDSFMCGSERVRVAWRCRRGDPLEGRFVQREIELALLSSPAPLADSYVNLRLLGDAWSCCGRTAGAEPERALDLCLEPFAACCDKAPADMSSRCFTSRETGDVKCGTLI